MMERAITVETEPEHSFGGAAAILGPVGPTQQLVQVRAAKCRPVHPLLVALRIAWRVLPPGPRDRLSTGLFLKMRPHPEPPREAEWRASGRPIRIADCEATAFGNTDAPVVMLVHGWQGRGLQLGQFIEPLVEAGYQPIALDFPGHGRTGGERSALPWMARTMARILGGEDAPAAVHAVIAHSIGGAGTILGADLAGWQGRILCLGGPPEAMGAFDRYTAMVDLPPRARRGFERRLSKMFDVMPEEMNVEAAARRLHCDMMGILVEGDDDVPPEESAQIVAAGGGSCVVIDGATHRSVMWDPRSLERGVAFVAGRSA